MIRTVIRPLAFFLLIAGLAATLYSCGGEKSPAAPTPASPPANTATFTVTPTPTQVGYCGDSSGTCTATLSPTPTFTRTATPTLTRTPTPLGCPATPAAYSLEWGSDGIGPGQFYYLSSTCLAVDPSGYVYVADYYNNVYWDRIQKFNASGSYQGAVTTENVMGETGGMIGLAVDASGNYYVGEDLQSRVRKFNSSGAAVTSWGSAGSGDGQFDGPGGLAVDTSGNVYVHDWRNYRIQKFSPSGAFLGKTSGSYNGYFNGPGGIAVAANGDIYTCSSYNGTVCRMNSSFAHLNYVPASGSLSAPWAVAVDGRGFVYVTETNAHRVKMFLPDGTLCKTWGKNGGDGTSGTGPGEFWYPNGIAADSVGNVYVFDGNDRVQKLAP